MKLYFFSIRCVHHCCPFRFPSLKQLPVLTDFQQSGLTQYHRFYAVERLKRFFSYTF
jgi:hypothetical protein